MNITKQQLKQLIQEELQSVINEGDEEQIIHRHPVAEAVERDASGAIDEVFKVIQRASGSRVMGSMPYVVSLRDGKVFKLKLDFTFFPPKKRRVPEEKP